MKRLVLLLPTVLLTGCLATAPVVPKWPDVPKDLLVACTDLKTLDPNNDKISTLIDTVADNYKEYYQCSDKVEDWIVWYNGQKKLWETVK
jgi:hypothetical protein